MRQEKGPVGNPTEVIFQLLNDKLVKGQTIIHVLGGLPKLDALRFERKKNDFS